MSEDFNSGLIIDDFKVEGKVPIVMERFTIERIVGDINVSRERFAFLCRMLLIVAQRARGLDEEDWTSEA